MFKNINILRPVLGILILFIPLYPKFPLLAVKGTYVAIRLDDIIVAVSVFIWFIYQTKHRFPFLNSKLSWAILPYFIAISVSSLNALFVFQTEPVNIILLHLFRRFEYISLLFVTVSTIRTVKDFFFPFYFFLISCIGVGIYGLGQKYWSFPVVSTMNEEFSKGQLLEISSWTRISSTFAGHYDLAVYSSIALILILGAIFLTKSKILKLIGFIVWSLTFYILTLTASRISVFAFWGGATLLLFLLKKYLWILPLSGLVIFSIISSKDLNQRLVATLPTIRINNPKPTLPTTPTPIPTLPPIAVISPIVKPKPVVYIPTPTPLPTILHHSSTEEYRPVDADAGVARSGEIRFNAEWPRAVNAFRKNPLLGTGPGSITLATDNDYLRALGETGLFGFITLFSIFLYFIFKTAAGSGSFKPPTSLPQNLSLVFLSSLMTFLASAVFIDVFEASKTAYFFWIIMGLYYQSLTLIPSKTTNK